MTRSAQLGRRAADGAPVSRDARVTVPGQHSAPSATLDDPAGAEIAGYRVLGQIGRGAAATVYRVGPPGSDGASGGTEYALKILDDIGTPDQESTVAFHREAALLASVNHPGLPRIHEVGTVDGRRLPGDGPRRRRAAQRRAAAHPAAPGAGRGDGDRHRRAARGGAPHRRGAPRHQARQHHGAADRIGAPDRLRAGGPADRAPQRHGRRHARVLPAGAGRHAQASRVQPVRPVLGRRGAVRVPRRPAAVPDPRRHANCCGCTRSRPCRTCGRWHRASRTRWPTSSPRCWPRIPTTATRTARNCWPTCAGWPRHPGAGSRSGTTGAAAHDPHQPLAGRATELGRVGAPWVAARNGTGGVGVIRGGAGAGKSRLAAEVARTARAEGALVLWGKSSMDDAVPLAPLREAIDAYLRDTERLPPPSPGGAPRADRRLRRRRGTAAGHAVPCAGRGPRVEPGGGRHRPAGPVHPRRGRLPHRAGPPVRRVAAGARRRAVARPGYQPGARPPLRRPRPDARAGARDGPRRRGQRRRDQRRPGRAEQHAGRRPHARPADRRRHRRTRRRAAARRRRGRPPGPRCSARAARAARSSSRSTCARSSTPACCGRTGAPGCWTTTAWPRWSCPTTRWAWCSPGSAASVRTCARLLVTAAVAGTRFRPDLVAAVHDVELARRAGRAARGGRPGADRGPLGRRVRVPARPHPGGAAGGDGRSGAARPDRRRARRAARRTGTPGRARLRGGAPLRRRRVARAGGPRARRVPHGRRVGAAELRAGQGGDAARARDDAHRRAGRPAAGAAGRRAQADRRVRARRRTAGAGARGGADRFARAHIFVLLADVHRAVWRTDAARDAVWRGLAEMRARLPRNPVALVLSTRSDVRRRGADAVDRHRLRHGARRSSAAGAK